MTLGIGILGLTHGHVRTYCQKWQANPSWGVAPVAAWDHDAARLAESASALKIEAAADAAALLARADIQAVVIGTETAYHADLVEQAAQAGKAIILQKPIALTMADARRIEQAVERHGVPFTMAWQMRVDPQNQQMRELVKNGDIGKVYMVRRRHGLPTQSWDWMASSWHADPALNRGMWADDASHAVDFLLWLLGEPQSVMAQVATLRDPRVPDDNGAAIYRYADGTLAVVECSFTCLAGENTTEIIGGKGSIIQNFGDLPSCNVPRDPSSPGLKWFIQGQKAWTHSPLASPASHGQRIEALARPLAEFLHGQRPAIATAGEGRQALNMLLASYKSSRTGRLVKLA